MDMETTQTIMAAITAAGTSAIGYVAGAIAAGLGIGVLIYSAKRAWGAFKSMR
ncbi:MAG: hypothetical protein AB2L09_02965 [Coriobacteriia bacterium]